ncbi:(d)CMP kinase [Salinarimonas ramus]|uniref:Cytidylate kinase n=1 Tax=Salinarimonas ramus TaxID=690164 RepID=A0A917V2W4_9HYPH|nr:(d)CMP kinase [Salinarimonas ramus]GGK31828.1 cytidylate kinase [Salinarimonas ramus]
MGFVIAVDGPAASGKGTLSKRIAAHYGFAHLDTGLLYRAVARLLLDKNRPLDDEKAAQAAAFALELAYMDESRLRGAEMGEAASRVSIIPAVRAALLDRQREFAAQAPGAVLDGRDIGTVICPDADVKLFVTASAEERARRRHRELESRGAAPAYESVLADIRARDARDAGRSSAPLRQAEDAVLLDTTTLGIEEALAAALAVVDKVRGASSLP